MLDLRRLGELLYEARTAAGLTQGELAAKAGVSLSYISMLENGQRNVTLGTLEAVVSALGRDLVVAIEQEMSPYHVDLMERLRNQLPMLNHAQLATLDILLRGWKTAAVGEDCQEVVKRA